MQSPVGQAIVNRVNFDAGRIRPSFSVDATVGAEMWKKDNFTLRLQGGVRNINNRLNLIDFGRVIFQEGDRSATQLCHSFADPLLVAVSNGEIFAGKEKEPDAPAPGSFDATSPLTARSR
jgi:hypothetical protein